VCGGAGDRCGSTFRRCRRRQGSRRSYGRTRKERGCSRPTCRCRQWEHSEQKTTWHSLAKAVSGGVRRPLMNEHVYVHLLQTHSLSRQPLVVVDRLLNTQPASHNRRHQGITTTYCHDAGAAGGKRSRPLGRSTDTYHSISLAIAPRLPWNTPRPTVSWTIATLRPAASSTAPRARRCSTTFAWDSSCRGPARLNFATGAAVLSGQP
jgi:hypothetical protein